MARKLAQVVFRGTILYMAQYFLFTVILLTALERVANFVRLADSIRALARRMESLLCRKSVLSL